MNPNSHEPCDGIDSPVDVRRCRFIASAPAVAPLSSMRLPGDSFVPVYIFPVVDERGRVEEEAIFGKPDVPLRDVPFGVPEARFLPKARSTRG